MTLIIISGEEEFLMERCAIEEASAHLSNETVKFYFPGQLEEYNYESQIPLFSGSTRSFVIFGAKEVPVMPDGEYDSLIVVIESKKKIEDKRAKRCVYFPKLKTYGDKNDVIKWILQEGERFNIDLSRVAMALFVSCGNCLRKLSSEVEKLSILTEKNGTVTPDTVRGVLCFSSVDLNPGQILDAVCDGNSAKALAFYDKLQELNEETGWIIAYMQRFIIQQIKLELLNDKKVSKKDAANILSLHEFIYGKLVQKRLGLWSKKTLTESIAILCELDVAHKSGDESSKFGLISEIIRLSEEAKNVKRK